MSAPKWLIMKDIAKYIVGFQNMPRNKGGEGSLYVKLKNRYKYKY